MFFYGEKYNFQINDQHENKLSLGKYFLCIKCIPGTVFRGCHWLILSKWVYILINQFCQFLHYIQFTFLIKFYNLFS